MTRRVLRAITRVVTAVWATVVLLSMVAVAAAALAGWQLTTIDSE